MGNKLLGWLFGVLARPVRTLNEIAREKPVGWAFLVYLIVVIPVLAVHFYSYGGLQVMEEVLFGLDLFIDPSVLLGGALAMVVILLLALTILLHLMARLFGGRGGYWNLFCAYSFAGFPLIITVPVTLVADYYGITASIQVGLAIFAFFIWVIILQVIALRESHGLSSAASIGAYLIHLLIIAAMPVAVVVALAAALLLTS